MERSHRVVVIGGGNAGLSVAGRLRRLGVRGIAVVEPRTEHVYAPLQSHIAGGTAPASILARPQGRVTPKGVAWIRDRATGVDPDARIVRLASGDTARYEHLVVAAGIEQRWGDIPGLAEALSAPEVVSSYRADLAAKASPVLRDLAGGTAVFAQPPEPASCAPVAQKPMFLAASWWEGTGVRPGIRIVFVSPERSAYPVPEIARELQRAMDAHGIEAHYDSDLIEVDASAREVVVGRGADRQRIAYDVLHATPPQAAAGWIAESGLAADDGFADVDPETLRHRRHDTVWALGDATAVASVRSGGGLRGQAKALARNLRDALSGRAPRSRYDGYTVSPITVTRHEMVFGEFDRDGLAPTIPGWRSLYRARRSTFLIDRWVLPWVYWHLILQGRA